MKLKSARDLNAYHLLQREKILIQQEALAVIESRLLADGHCAGSPEVKP